MTRYLLFSLFFLSCTSGESEFASENYHISEAELFLSPEINDQAIQPWSLKAIDETLFMYDFGLHTVSIIDNEGAPEITFGAEGKGPGELQSVTGIWRFDEQIMLYDSRNAKHLFFSEAGKHIRDINLDQQNFSTTLEAVGINQFYIPANGEKEALIRYVDTKNDLSVLFGDAVSKQEEVSMDNARKSIEKNQVPRFMQNQLALSANESGIFSFQQTTGVLQKFSHAGHLEWEHTLNHTFMEDIFKQFIENNKLMMERGNIIFLQYANHIEANDDGVAILLATPKTEPATLVWVSNEGSKSATITLDFIHDAAEKPISFTISRRSDEIYFINPFAGNVYRADWPF